MSDIVYVQEADAMERHERHGQRSQTYAFGEPWDPIKHPEGFRAYVKLGRYRPKAQLHWETNAWGRRTYFSDKAHLILAAVLHELEAGRDLHTMVLAKMTGASQGYVTKVLKKLHLWRFIVVSAVVRGRWGRIVASIARRQSFLHTRRATAIWRNDYRASLTEERYQRDIDPILRALAAKPWTADELGVL